MRYGIVLTMLLAAPVAAAQEATPDLEMWRLDCGAIQLADLGIFSDTGDYAGEEFRMTSSCYLIRNGQEYLLWDTGLPAALIEQPAAPDTDPLPVLTTTIGDQLAQIGVTPQQIQRIGISHYHFDHMGQAADFPDATMLIGANDWQALQGDHAPYGAEPGLAQPWLDGGNVQPLSADTDVFGDGSVTVLRLPGHTPGSTGLLVRLPQTGPVLLSGDLLHVREQIANRGVPPFNTDRADTLASVDRLTQMAENLDARLIIQHDPRDIEKLPSFPESAK